MGKPKRKLSPAQKAAKRQRQKEYMTIFIRGKQKQVKRPPTIDGMDVDEFIRINADPIWLTQNEMWEELQALEDARDEVCVEKKESKEASADEDSDIPF